MEDHSSRPLDLPPDSTADAAADRVASAAATIREPLGPIREGERLIQLDVLRGFAILGILFVNMQYFAMPLMQVVSDPSLATAPTGEKLSWAFIKVFCEFKFISLFSLLFGVGLIVQMTRAETRGRVFVPVFLRRLGVLALIGLAHATLLWFGDILFIYAVLGVPLLFMRKLRPRTLIIIAAILLGVTSLFSLAGGAAQTFGNTMRARAELAAVEAAGDDAAAAAPSIPEAPSGDEAGENTSAKAADDAGNDAGNKTAAADGNREAGNEADHKADNETTEDAGEAAGDQAAPADEPRPPLRGWAAIGASGLDPNAEGWREAEIAAYRDGPFRDAFAFRVITYAFAMISTILVFGWRIGAMFLLGAAMMKSGFFLPERRAWHRRACLYGLGIGLPMELGAAAITIGHDFQPGWMILPSQFLHEWGSVFLCLGYTGAVMLITTSRLPRSLFVPLASVGRLALSAYLAETVLATMFMYWWGWGWFGAVTLTQQVGLAAAIYAGLAVVCTFWIRVFAIGPAEWLWRSLTYGRPQSLLRRRAAAD